MFAPLITIFVGTVFVLVAYQLGNGNTALNLFSALALVTLIVWFLPELRGLPLPAYGFTWLVAFAGIQFFLPAAEGKPFVWMWQPTRRFIVAVAVA